MEPSIDATVFIVDDDGGVRGALAWLLRSRHLHSECYESAEIFYAMLLKREANRDQSRCLLLDVRMPGMSGLALFQTLVEQRLHLAMPVIFLTGHADVPTAVEAVKHGAFDFCEKPFSDNALVDRVEHALVQSAQVLVTQREKARLRARLQELTDRERDVMRLVMDGLANKAIADHLEISVRTVEVHRSRVFEKVNVKSAVELANLLRSYND